MWTAIYIIPTQLSQQLTYENVLLATEILSNRCLQFYVETVHCQLKLKQQNQTIVPLPNPREDFTWAAPETISLQLSATTLCDEPLAPLDIFCRSLSAAADLESTLHSQGPRIMQTSAVNDAVALDVYWQFACNNDDRPTRKILQGYLALVIATLCDGVIYFEPLAGEGSLVSITDFWRSYMDFCPTIVEPQETVSQILEATIANQPWRQEVNTLLAQVYTYKEQQDYDGAIAAYLKVIELSPQYSFFHSELGRIYHDAGRHAAAVAAYEQAIAQNQTKAHYYSNLGLAHKSLKAYDAAVVAFQRSIELNPSGHKAYHELGDTYRLQRKFEAAIAAHEQAIALNPDAMYYRYLGHTYFDQGNYGRAIEIYTTTVGLSPRDQWAFDWRGNAYEKLGQYDLALQDYKQVILLDSTHDWAIESHIRVWRLLQQSDTPR